MFQGSSLSWLEDFIRITAGPRPTTAGFSPPPGFSTVILKDLTAETAEYVYTDADGIEWLYGNGAEVSQSTYADLFAFFGANAWGTDTGGNFYLPDGRGRGLFMCGTNAAADLGDNDGVAEASRQAQHSPAITGLTVTGAPGGTFGSSSHTHTGPSHTHPLNLFAGTSPGDSSAQFAGTSETFAGGTGATGAPSATASPTLGTLDVGGTVGSGMTGDGPAHLYIGSLLVRF